MIFNGNVKSTINARRVTRERSTGRIIARRDSKNREIKPEGLIGDDRREKACWRTNSTGIIKKKEGERETERRSGTRNEVGEGKRGNKTGVRYSPISSQPGPDK